MKKIKNISSAKKRFKKNTSGNFKYKHSNLRHLLTKKSTKRKRHLRPNNIICKKNIAIIKKFLPYKNK